MNWKFPDYSESEEPEFKFPTFIASWRKQGNSIKTSTSASLTVQKPLIVWITTNYRKLLKRWEYQTTLPVSWETCMQVKKQQNLTWNNWLAQNWERSPTNLYIVTFICEVPGWVKHKLESRLAGEISITADTQMTPHLWQKVRTKEPLDASKRRVKKLA